MNSLLKQKNCSLEIERTHTLRLVPPRDWCHLATDVTLRLVSPCNWFYQKSKKFQF